MDENDFEVIDILEDDDDDIEIIDVPDGGTKKKKAGKEIVASKIKSMKNSHLYNIWKSSANYNE